MIPFTQFVLPKGQRKQTTIERPPHIETMAFELIEAGFRFESEILRTGEIHMVCNHPNDEGDIATVLCDNGPDVLGQVDELVTNAYRRWKERP